MDSTLIIYSTTDGQTKLICKKLINEHFDHNDTQLCSLSESSKKNLSDYKKIIIGASIRYGKHNPQLFNFINKNQDILNRLNTAFFSVNVVARKTAKNTPLTNPYVINMTQKNTLNIKNGAMIIFIFLTEKKQEGQEVYFLIT